MKILVVVPILMTKYSDAGGRLPGLQEKVIILILHSGGRNYVSFYTTRAGRHALIEALHTCSHEC